MVWFRNSMADSCSNLNRSRTELLASISRPTWSGRLVSAWKLRIISGGLLSSRTRKSFCLRSVMRRPCLSVTVNTTFTSLGRTRMTATASLSAAAAASAVFCSCPAAVAGGVLAGGVCGGAAAGGETGAADVGAAAAGAAEVCAAGVGAADCGVALPANSSRAIP